jgi:hypothetical protein
MAQRLIDDALWTRVAPAATQAAATPLESHGPAPRPRSGRVNGHPVRVAERAAVANAPEGDGLWIGQHVLATVGVVATGRGVTRSSRTALELTYPAWRNHCRQ